ncbi:MAG: helix-turn-helix domain-containing protein [Cyanobacteria bacterium SBLK]|nr:helix-turn-helix domain-containing protein [Cyanobacteria bacterium SBLK]
MVEEPNLFWFGLVLWLGGTVYLLGLLGARNRAREDFAQEISDSLLSDRLKRVGISHWNTLQRKAGLTPKQMERVRQGKLEGLTLKELNQLARILNWSLEELLQNYGYSFPSLGEAFQEIARLHQKYGELQQERIKVEQESREYQSTLAEASQQIELLEERYENLERDKQKKIDRLSLELQDASNRIEQLEKQCLRLRAELQDNLERIKGDIREETFEQLQTLMMNFPTACVMAEAKPNLPARNFIALFTPLNNLLQEWGYESIGTAWEQVIFDPQIHQADSDDIQEGDLVFVRFVGYRSGDLILCPAKVSRSLPNK